MATGSCRDEGSDEDVVARSETGSASDATGEGDLLSADASDLFDTPDERLEEMTAEDAESMDPRVFDRVDPDEIDSDLVDRDVVDPHGDASDGGPADSRSADSEGDGAGDDAGGDLAATDRATEPTPVDGGLEVSGDVFADLESDSSDVGPDEPDADPLPTFDCATVPDGERTMTPLPFARAHDGVTFDAAGVFIGAANPHVMRSFYDAPAEIIAPNVGNMYQMDILPDGDYVVQEGDTNTIRRISPDGSVSTLASDVGGYSLRVFPDGLVYAGASFSTGDADDLIYRIDPETGDKTTYIESDRLQPRGFDLGHDLSRVYLGTADCSGNGRIWVVDVDDDFNPLGEPRIFATGVGDGWHDGVGVDACGNVWVTEFCSGILWRISADGSEVEEMLEYNPGGGWDFDQYGHAVIWGSGVGGWMDQALYMPQPNNDNHVIEVVIGVPSRAFDGIVINALDPP